MEQQFIDEGRPARYATRQPMLAADETVIGYKLLFRTDVVSHYSAVEASESARTTIDISTLLGLDILCDNRLAFITCNRDVLLEQTVAFLRRTGWLSKSSLPWLWTTLSCSLLRTEKRRIQDRAR